MTRLDLYFVNTVTGQQFVTGDITTASSMQNEAKTIIPERKKGNTADVVTSSDSFQKIRARTERSRAAVVAGDAKLTADTITRGWSVLYD